MRLTFTVIVSMLLMSCGINNNSQDPTERVDMGLDAGSSSADTPQDLDSGSSERPDANIGPASDSPKDLDSGSSNPPLCDGTQMPYSVISVYEADGQTPYCGPMTVRVKWETAWNNMEYEDILTQDDCVLGTALDIDMGRDGGGCSCYLSQVNFTYTIQTPDHGTTVEKMVMGSSECSAGNQVTETLPFE